MFFTSLEKYYFTFGRICTDIMRLTASLSLSYQGVLSVLTARLILAFIL